MIPGEVRVSGESLDLNSTARRITIVIVNDGDRPIQVGSHLHLPDANPALTFDREQARGFRLDVPAGTSVRLEPGVSRTVALIELGGLKRVPGLQIHEDLPTHAREPKTVIPWGTPGVEVEEPLRASVVRARLSDVVLESEDEPDDVDEGGHSEAPVNENPEEESK